MIRSRGLRLVYLFLGLMAVALPFLVAQDRGERFDGDYAGLLVSLAPMAIALLAYAAPRPPAEGEVEESETVTVTIGDRTHTGTAIQLPRRRRVARVLYRTGWLAFFVLLGVVGLMQGDTALAIVTFVVGLLLLLGFVSSVRGLLDPSRTGVFIGPEGVRFGPHERQYVEWGDVERFEVYPFDFRGFTTYALRLHHREGRPIRMVESRLPARAEVLAETLERHAVRARRE